MRVKYRFTLSALMLTVFLPLSHAAMAQDRPARKKSDHPTASAATSPVSGGGTVGQLSKWVGVAGASTYVLGDSNIFEDKFGNVGIGTTAPTAKLTVKGMIEIQLGGLKFPDGTLQTTAGLPSVFHNATLTGKGTADSPLGVADPLKLNRAELEQLIVNDGARTKFLSVTGGAHIGGSLTVDEYVNVERFVDINGGLTSAGDNDHIDGVIAIGDEEIGTAGGNGIHATAGSGAPDGYAGLFHGDVRIVGKLQVTGTKNFQIDHPLDPENKYLNHAAIESSEVKNLYDGIATLDQNGEAVVTMPEWFQAVNKDFRYTLTAVGAPAPNLYVAEKVTNNRFRIAGGAPGMEVSWQVTGVRSDPVMARQPFQTEEAKPEVERGYYLNPEAYHQPAERGVEWGRHPEKMRRMKVAREKARKQKLQ